MTLQEIKEAVDNGKIVHWSNPRYSVIKSTKGSYYINCSGGSTIGLTWADEITLNGEPDQFYIQENL